MIEIGKLITQEKKDKIKAALMNPYNFSPNLTSMARQHEVSVSTLHWMVKRELRVNHSLTSNKQTFRIQLQDLPGFIRSIVNNGGKVMSVDAKADEVLEAVVLLNFGG